MYIYGINKDGYLCNELVNQMFENQGLVNNKWQSAERIKYMTPNGEYAYSVVDGKLVKADFDEISYYKKDLIKQIKKLVVAIISDYDWKMIRHEEQLLLLKEGDDIVLSLTDEDYINILRAKQVLRDLSNIGEKLISLLTTTQEIEWTREALLFDYNDEKVAKTKLAIFTKNYERMINV